jgi:hypothetical protein
VTKRKKYVSDSVKQLHVPHEIKPDRKNACEFGVFTRRKDMNLSLVQFSELAARASVRVEKIKVFCRGPYVPTADVQKKFGTLTQKNRRYFFRNSCLRARIRRDCVRTNPDWKSHPCGIEERIGIASQELLEFFVCKYSHCSLGRKNQTDLDVDGVRILDYAGEVIVNQGKSISAIVEGLVRPAYEFIVAQEQRFIATGDAKLIPRYRSARPYFESRLPLWGLTKIESRVLADPDQTVGEGRRVRVYFNPRRFGDYES